MRFWGPLVLLMAAWVLCPIGARAEATGVALASVARSAHLDYQWLGASGAVQLTGPGLVLVVRPGNNVYEVNDRIEVASVAPHFASNDIYVSRAMANRIAQLARRAWGLANAQAMHAEAVANDQNAGAPVPAMQGTIVLSAVPLKGAEAVLITGQAPPSAPVLITLLATLSSDLPNVLLSRNDLTAGPDGKFQAIVPIAPDYMRDTFVRVLATSVPGVISASAEIVVHAPNAGVKVPAEAIPGGIW